MSRRYYPGFLAALFLVLLRTSIGWHFLYEGLEKLNPPDAKPFTAEGYLRASTGPLAPFFRSHIPDVEGTARFVRDDHGLPAKLKESWKAELDRFSAHYNLTPDQVVTAQKALTDTEAKADFWFRNLENVEKLNKYEADLQRIKKIESNPKALTYQRQLAWKDRKEIDATRKELNADIDAMAGAMRDVWLKEVPETARETPVEEPRTQLDDVNLATKILLVGAGAGLMLGLFSRLSALGAAAFLMMTYLTMPPWPGLPIAPNAEGHYLFVNKNLIEFLACMALVFLPTGQWIGFDAILFGWIGRRREARRLARESAAQGANAAPLDAHHSAGNSLTRRAR